MAERERGGARRQIHHPPVPIGIPLNEHLERVAGAAIRNHALKGDRLADLQRGQAGGDVVNQRGGIANEGGEFPTVLTTELIAQLSRTW